MRIPVFYILMTSLGLCFMTLLIRSGLELPFGGNSGQDECEFDKTKSSSDVILIPDDPALNKMNEEQHMEFYLKYVNTLQALCRNIIRVGNLKDGGKEICVDEKYKPKAPCLVYSFGIANKVDFDDMIVDLFGCEVHCFDPSIKKISSEVSDKVWFYRIGLGDFDGINQRNWEIKTLKTIKTTLKHTHRTIDVLKIDVEGAEWTSILQMAESGILTEVKQIAIELHFPLRWLMKPKGWRDKATNVPLLALRRLYEVGFRIVMRDRNIYVLRKLKQFKYNVTLCYEITLVNIKYMDI